MSVADVPRGGEGSLVFHLLVCFYFRPLLLYLKFINQNCNLHINHYVRTLSSQFLGGKCQEITDCRILLAVPAIVCVNTLGQQVLYNQTLVAS